MNLISKSQYHSCLIGRTQRRKNERKERTLVCFPSNFIRSRFKNVVFFKKNGTKFNWKSRKVEILKRWVATQHYESPLIFGVVLVESRRIRIQMCSMMRAHFLLLKQDWRWQKLLIFKPRASSTSMEYCP